MNKSIKNIGEFTIQTKLYGKLIEIAPGWTINEENFFMFDEKGRDEILRFLAIKLKKDGYKIELMNFGDEIECPCCGTKIQIKETTKSKKGKKKEK